MLTPQEFRDLFPVYNDEIRYPDATLTPWLTIADSLIDPQRWGELYNLGQGLFVAHNLALNALDERGGASGIPGIISGGIVSGKSVGSVSVSYDTSQGIEDKAGHWGLTTFGNRFLRYLRLVGMGGVQSGPDFVPGNTWGRGWRGVV
jgi:hypothetical protein